MVHGIDENRTHIPLKSLAIPAGFEPATHGVEIRYSIQLSRGRRYGNFARIDQRELARSFGNCTADGARRREISRRRSAGPSPAREAKQQALLASDAGADPEAQPFQPPDFEAGNAFARVDQNSDFPSCLQIMRKAAAAMKNYIAISMI
jgi:hypothetical protein